MDITFFARQFYGDIARFGPNRPAIGLEDDTPLTYGQLAHKVSSYANGLLDLGVCKGDRVGILLYNSVEYFVAYFAIARIGAIGVRLNFRLGPTELEYALKDSGVTVLLASAELLTKIEELHASLAVKHYVCHGDTQEVPTWALPWSVLETGSPCEPPVPLPKADDPNMIMYTSGTTGQAKGSIWSHGITTFWTAMQIMEWGFTQESTTFVTGPLYHIGGIENYSLPTLAVGGRVVLLRSKNFSIVRTLEIASRQRATDMLLFPTMIYQMLQTPAIQHIDLTGLRRVFSGGDPLLPSAIKEMERRYSWIDIVQLYGLTEGTPMTACGGPGFARKRPESVGRAYPFVEVSIRDDDGAVLPPGETGEIWSRSPANSLGYWNKPEATAATFVDGWCKTGDLGVVEDGFLRIAGRKKDMIRSGGENIYPVEIEDVLLRHPSIRDVAVVGMPDPVYIESVCAFVVLTADQHISEDDVIQYCAQHLAGYKKPRKVIFVEEIPRTTSNKIMKYVLREQLEGHSNPSV